MRPVTVNPKPTYQIPPEMTVRRVILRDGLVNNGLKPVKKTKATVTFKTQAVLDLLNGFTATNKGAAKWRKLPPDDQELATALISYFTDNETMKYGNSRGSLIDNYGQYCSYCGTMVQDIALAVEHCMPKAEFPGYMLAYTNFFLACPSCNSNKSSQPNYTTASKWAVAHIAPTPTLQQIVDGGFGRQLWANDTLAWTGFPVGLYDVTNKKFISPADTLNLGNTLVGTAQNSVQAQIAGYKAPITVAALFGTDAGKDPILQQREDNFIDIVKLNAYQIGVYSDRRVTNRTVTWLKILQSLQNLQSFGKPGTAPWMIMLKQIFSTAVSAGFFEVWAWLFYWISPPSTGTYSIYLQFRTAAADFPGTNIAALPTK